MKDNNTVSSESHLTATKGDVAKLEASTKSAMVALKSDFADLKTSTKADMTELRTDMADLKADFTDLKTSTKADLVALEERTNLRFDAMFELIKTTAQETRAHFDVVAENIHEERLKALEPSF